MRSWRKGSRRDVTTQGMTVRMNERACREDARYNGQCVLRTNTTLPLAEVVAAYKQAWHIERVLHTLKSPLDLCPMFHGTEAWILGHITVCVFALVLEYTLQRLLREAEVTASTRAILQDLQRVQAVP